MGCVFLCTHTHTHSCTHTHQYVNLHNDVYAAADEFDALAQQGLSTIAFKKQEQMRGLTYNSRELWFELCNHKCMLQLCLCKHGCLV